MRLNILFFVILSLQSLNIRILVINEKTKQFIEAHSTDDVRRLAFTASETLGDDAPFALDQIMGRQKAFHKLPSWAKVDGIIYPPHISMEQCSSEQTAKYKADVVKRVLGELFNSDVIPADTELVDLTGGFGVDFSFMARNFGRATYIERLPHLCEAADHNMPLLGLDNVSIINKEMGTDDILSFFEAKENSVVFIDPARRDRNGGRTYAIADCTPDICGFIGELLQKVVCIMVKLSPMLDWHAVVEELNRRASGSVREIHIVSTGNECKELLVVMTGRSRSGSSPVVYCVNDNDCFSFGNATPLDGAQQQNVSLSAGKVLLVPNASVMKAGCFREVEMTFGIGQLASSSHLFLSNGPIEHFPGKQYRIIAVSSLNKKEIKSTLQGMENANISCRNFPMKPEELRKKLKLKDGGEHYIFATTTAKNEKVLIITYPFHHLPSGRP